MRNRRNFKKRFKTLKGEQKTLLFASLTSIVGCFLPWYGISSRVINEWWSGFGSIGFIAGYTISLFAFSLILLTLLPLWDIKPQLPWKSEKLQVFFSAQAFFIALLFLAVYAQYSIYDSPNSSIRFGIYVTIASTAIASISALIIAKNADKGRISFSTPELMNVPRHHQGIESAELELQPETFENLEQETLIKEDFEQLAPKYSQKAHQETNNYQNEALKKTDEDKVTAKAEQKDIFIKPASPLKQQKPKIITHTEPTLSKRELTEQKPQKYESRDSSKVGSETTHHSSIELRQKESVIAEKQQEEVLGKVSLVTPEKGEQQEKDSTFQTNQAKVSQTEEERTPRKVSEQKSEKKEEEEHSFTF
jgi:hypothetical protein